MARRQSEIELLHSELFGSVPNKAGVAYERVAAVVMATLGWADIVHDRTERPAGRLTDHQLDVTCRTTDGSVRRLLIECKDWDTQLVGQDELLKLATVKDRIGASHAAMITKVGFTEGARAVAVDDDIALIRLRPYDAPTDDGTWVKEVTFELTIGSPVIENLELMTPDGPRSAADAGVPSESWMDVFDAVGQPVATWADLFAAGAAENEREGRVHKRLDLPARRQVEGRGGLVAIDGLRWSERVVTDTTRFAVKARGTPRIVLQQLDAQGLPHSGQVIVDEKLQAWTFSPNGDVIGRVALPEEA